jgi:carboxylesterase
MDSQPKRTAVLVCHGFTAQPKTVDYLASFLQRAGFAFEIPVLRGHGSRPEDLVGVRWQDWLEDAMAAYERLEAKADRVLVVGHSMGALIAANVVVRYPEVPALVMVAPALQFVNPAVKFLPLLGGIVKFWNGGPSGIVDPALRAQSIAEAVTYKRFPVKAFKELWDLAQLTPKELEKIRCPTLVIHSRVDEVIPASAAELAVRSLGTQDRRLKWFERSSHEMFWDLERDELCETIVKFLLEHAFMRSEQVKS